MSVPLLNNHRGHNWCGLHLKTLCVFLDAYSANFALVKIFFKFGGCRLLLIISDVESAVRLPVPGFVEFRVT